MPWGREEGVEDEGEAMRDSTGNIEELKDLFANPTSLGSSGEALRTKLILPVLSSLLVSATATSA